ncbi:MAG: hypothetical protein P8J87_20315, partial [Verrucomicrobiales bacterium]|nr:hypothetical protein [Verrucomicrobiales bacterium]
QHRRAQKSRYFCISRGLSFLYILLFSPRPWFLRGGMPNSFLRFSNPELPTHNPEKPQKTPLSAHPAVLTPL